MRKISWPLYLAFVTASVSYASDVWVDPVTGNDGNPGTASAPFKTISHAVMLSGVTVHLAPGDYSAATGETYPIQLEDGDSLVSLAGRDQTRILLPPDNGTALGGIEVEGAVSMSGLTFESQGTEAVAVAIGNYSSPWPNVTVVDSRFVGGAVGIVGTICSLYTERCEFLGQADEALLLHGGWFSLADLVIRDVNRGVNVVMFDGLDVTMTVERTSIADVANEAVMLWNGSSHGNQLNARFNDCLLAGHNVGLQDRPSNFGANLTLSGCTIVSDRGVGIGQGSSFPTPSLIGCIVAGHPGGDVLPNANLSHCLIEDGLPQSSSASNLTGDPIFVDRAAGDFRLGWGSPCIDSGQPGTGRDFFNRPRVVDGDLQLAPGPDMGALEHQTLSGPISAALGNPIPLEVTGPSGGFSTVAVSPTGYAASGATTPYGRFFLDPTTVYRITPVGTLGVTPTALLVPAFSDPALVGTQVGFQALTRSLAAPAGGAYSQPILVRIDT